MSVLDSIVDRVVIRGDPLTEPEVSESWLKVRAVLAIVAVALPGVMIARTAPGIGTGIALGAGTSAFVVVTRRIKERIGEVEEQEVEHGL
jgi:hypothetical protein